MKSIKTSTYSRIFAASAAILLISMQLALTVAADTSDEPLPDAPEISRCDAAYLYNIENDIAIFEYNSDERVYPASTVKLMTAIVAFEQCGDRLDERITVTEAMANEVAGNKIGLVVGEVVTYRQMLSCMLVNSANDAAIVLAHAISGSTPEFVRLMNEKAAELGADSTKYTNPTGMHNNAMVTTAADTAKIARYAYTIPGFVEMTAQTKYTLDATNLSSSRTVYNRNAMISKYYHTGYFYKDALGMNAGATTQGGYALCALAERNGLTYIAVVLGAEAEDTVCYNYENGIKMLDWAFEAYDYATLLTSSRVICEIPVKLSTAVDYMTLTPKNEIVSFIPTKINVKTDITYDYVTYEDELIAPIEAGVEVGEITVMYGDEVMGKCPLVTTMSVNRSEFLFALSQIKAFTEGELFRGALIAIVVFSILYVLVKARRREKRIRRVGRR